MSTKAESAIGGQNAGRLAWLLALSAIGGSLFAFAIGIFFLVKYGDSPTLSLDDLLIPIPTAAYALIGALIAARHPRNPIGWIFIAVGWLYSLDITIDVYRTYSAVMGSAGTLPPLAHNLWVPRILLPTIFVFFLFPDGAHLSRWWRLLYWSASIALVVQHFALAFHPGPVPNFDIDTNPDGLPQLAGELDVVLSLTQLLLLLGIVGSIAAFVIRLRRSRGVEHQQMKWLSYAIGLTLLSLVLNSLAWTLLPEDSLVTALSEQMLELSVLGIAVATGIAILRYRLYDIDFIINRTLVYGALSASVVGIYVLLVGGLGTFFQAQGNLVIALLATGLIAVLFQQLRERLQKRVNRLMFGERDDPYVILSKLSGQLQTTATPKATLQSVVETVAETLKLPYVAIELADKQGPLGGAATGNPLADKLELPLRYQNETVGRLVVSPRSPGETFNEREQQLLADIAAHTGPMAHAVRLTAALQRSREKLVLTREEERRRIRRDLHDELGPTLASQTFSFDAILDLLETNPQEAARLLRGLKSQNQETVADIRRLVHELRPPALDELGLLGALQAHVAKLDGRPALPINITATPNPLPPLSAAVEVAAYRIALEAITNVVRHAKAQQCAVQLKVIENGRPHLQITITDNGLGLPAKPDYGVGFHSMRERAEELGGSLTITNQQKGTRVKANLPLSATKEQIDR